MISLPNISRCGATPSELDDICGWFEDYPGESATDWICGPNDVLAWREKCRPWFGRADAYVYYIESNLCHSKGEWAGKPFLLIPWERSFVRRLFGWQRGEVRRFTKVSVWIPKKNGKSMLSSGTALVLADADLEPGAEVYCAATDRKQALIVFGECERMVRSSPELRAKFECFKTTKTIDNPMTYSKIQAISADAYTNEGLNASGVIVDELHAHRSRKLFDALRYSGAARRQPLFFTISTAGEEEESVGYEEYSYAKGVLDGSVTDTSCLAVVYEATPEDDWSSEDVWRKANPSYGVTIRPEEMREAFNEAKTSGAKENAFRRYRLNQWTKQTVRWIQLDRWDACADTFTEADLAGRVCFGGFDLSTHRDSTALALVFPPTDNDPKTRLLVRFYMPEQEIGERELRDRAPYREWSKQGWLTLTPSITTDYSFVRHQILECQKKFDLREWGYDPWNATHLVNELLNDDGLDNMVEVRQGYASLSAPSKEFDRLIVAGELAHNGNAMMRRQIDSVAISMDPAGNLKPDKSKATHKIDGVVAGIVALSRAMVGAETNSYFQQNDLLVL